MLKSATTINPIHPGEVLQEEFMEPLGISANKLAHRIDVPTNRITAIIKGQRGVSGDTALRLSKVFGTTPEFWINIQGYYEIECAKDNTGADIQKIEQFAA
ncbi:MAG: HigA family addiction module antitoxin [Desulfobulbia bacterium]